MSNFCDKCWNWNTYSRGFVKSLPCVSQPLNRTNNRSDNKWLETIEKEKENDFTEKNFEENIHFSCSTDLVIHSLALFKNKNEKYG